MKKVLSMLLALAMVLTMAAFPAFAEEPAQINVADVTSKFTPGNEYTLLGVVDGTGVGDSGATNANYFRASTNITSSGTKGDAPNDKNFHVVVDFSVPHNVTGLRANWGGKYATGIVLWASNDKVTWTEIADLTPTTQTSENTVSHEGYYRYVKVEAYKTLDNNPACGELTFYGTMSPDYAKVTGITAADITTSGGSLYSSTSLGITPDKASLVDGDVSNTTVNTVTFGWSGTAKTIEVTLPETVNLSTLALYWGNKKGADNAWNVRPAKTYEIFLAGEDGVYGEAAYSHNDTTLTGTPRGTNRNDVVTFDTPVEGVKKIKVVVSNHYAEGCLAIRELEIFKYTKEVVKIPATYTVKYKSDDPNFVAPADKVVEGKYVGNKVTETAPVITGYTVDEASKEITLVDGTNEIVFTYTARPAATYTVEYVDTEGNPVADAKEVTTGFYADDKVTETAVAVTGYKPTETSKEVTLAAGANTITFIYNAAESVTYTVNYVDAAGNPIADAKTGEGYEYDVISEDAPNFYAKGYFITGTDLTKKMELALDSDNEITFVYKKVIKVISFKKTLHNSTDGLWNVSRMYNGEILGDYDQLNTNKTSGTPAAEMIFVLDGIYNLEKMTTYWGSNNANTISVYVSKDGTNWGEPVYSGESADVKTNYANGDTTTAAYVFEVDLKGTKGQYVKYVVEEAQTGWLPIREFTFEGENLLANEIELTEDNVISNKNFGAQVLSEGRLGSLGSMFDGEVATKENSNWANIWYGDNLVDVINGTNSQGKPWSPHEFTIDLGGVYDLTYAALQGGLTGHGSPAPAGYDIYVAGVDGEFRLANSYVDANYEIGDALINNYVVKNVHEINEDNVRYVKVVITRASGRTAVGEFDVYGTKIDLAANPEKAGASNGAQIRLPSGTVPAGIRFGATIAKDVFGDVLTDGYNYSELAAAGIKVGMFILPTKMLDGNATLADYIANGGDKALDVAAEKIYAEDDIAVTFTAVLISIPEADYTTDVVAVPYICINGEYTFYEEMTRNYKQVTEAVAEAYEKGEITLTETQIALVEAIIGRTLTVA